MPGFRRGRGAGEGAGISCSTGFLRLSCPRLRSALPISSQCAIKAGRCQLGDYRREVQAVLRTTRATFVTPSTYGTDNRCLTDALARCGKDARGVAVVDPGISNSELQQLHDAGVRGVRVKLPKAELVALSNQIHELGWHMEFYVPGEELADMEETLMSLPTPIVLDHLAHLREPHALQSLAYGTVRRLLDTGHC